MVVIVMIILNARDANKEQGVGIGRKRAIK